MMVSSTLRWSNVEYLSRFPVQCLGDAVFSTSSDIGCCVECLFF